MMAPRAFDVATGATISRSRRWLAFVILLIGALMDLVDATYSECRIAHSAN